MCGTAGFVRHRANTGTVCTRTCYGYGVCGYGYSVENPDPWYTRDIPYRSSAFHSACSCRQPSVYSWRFCIYVTTLGTPL